MKEKNLKDFLPDKNSSYYKKLNNNEANENILKKDVVDQIKKVMDPEIPVNLYDLGLIYNIFIGSLTFMLPLVSNSHLKPPLFKSFFTKFFSPNNSCKYLQGSHKS